MRLREPLNGIKLASGHWIFHLAFLIGSLIAINIPNPDTVCDTDNFIPGDLGLDTSSV